MSALGDQFRAAADAADAQEAALTEARRQVEEKDAKIAADAATIASLTEKVATWKAKTLLWRNRYEECAAGVPKA